MNRILVPLAFLVSLTAACSRDGLSPENPDMLPSPTICHSDDDCPTGQWCKGTTGHNDTCVPIPQGEINVRMGANLPSGGGVYLDATGIVMNSVNASASKTRDVQLQAIQFHHSGTGAWSDFTKVILNCNTVGFGIVQTQATYDEKTAIATFTFPQPIRIPAGTTMEATLFADVWTKQAGRTHSLSLLNAGDIKALANTAVTGTFPIPGATITIALTPVLVVEKDKVNARTAKVGGQKMVLQQFWFNHTVPLDIKRLYAKIVSQNNNAYVVGSKGTVYFRNLRVVDTASGSVAMGPYTPTVPSGSVTTNTFALIDQFGDSQHQLQLIADLADQEDSPGEFIGQTYVVTMGDEDALNMEFFHGGDVCQPNGGMCYDSDRIGFNNPGKTIVTVVQ